MLAGVDMHPDQLTITVETVRAPTVKTNGWDPAVLQRFREDQVVTSIPGSIDHKAAAEQIEHIATLIPDEWLAPSATGSARQCVIAAPGLGTSRPRGGMRHPGGPNGPNLAATL
jgi:hypothetical protein